MFPSRDPVEVSFVADVRSAGLQDDDETLLAVGYDICYEIQERGEAWMRSNFAQSSFSQDEQAAIVSAAKLHLCSPPTTVTLPSAAPESSPSESPSKIQTPTEPVRHKGTVKGYARMVNKEAKWVWRSMREIDTCIRDPYNVTCDSKTPSDLAAFTGHLRFRLMSAGNFNFTDLYLGTLPKQMVELIERTKEAAQSAKAAATNADTACGSWLNKPRCQTALRHSQSVNKALASALTEWQTLGR